MARGKSGRIVLEIDPILKRKLYLVLENNQITLKDWFLKAAASYVTDNNRSFIDQTLIAEINNNNYSTVKKEKNELD